MSTIGSFDPKDLVCTFCGKTPVVGFTFVVNSSSLDEALKVNPDEVDEKSIVAVCKDHLPILQEQVEQLEREHGEGIEVKSDE